MVVKTEAPVAVIDTEAVEVIDESNAKNSLDWAGTYKGVLPAADAEGMDVTIVLSPEYTFTKTYSYVGKKVSQKLKLVALLGVRMETLLFW